MVLRAFDEIFEISCYSVMLENIGCASGTVEKNSSSTNPESPRDRLFISNCFELPSDWLSQ